MEIQQGQNKFHHSRLLYKMGHYFLDTQYDMSGVVLRFYLGHFHVIPHLSSTFISFTFEVHEILRSKMQDLFFESFCSEKWNTECPKIFRNPVLHSIDSGILKQGQYIFAVNLGTLSLQFSES